MTRTLHNTIHRIHRDREALRLVLARRLTRVMRNMAADATRSDRPELSVAANDELSGMVARQALIARLNGVRRSVLEFERATGRKYMRSVNLSREADKEDKRDREYLLWLLAFLTPIVGQQAIASYRTQAIATGRRAAEQIKTPVMRELAAAFEAGPAASLKTVNFTDLPSADPFGTYGKPDQAGSLVDEFAPEVDRIGKAATVRKAFNKAGVGTIHTRTTDLWAETVSYVEFERGRFDGHALPAVAEMLWGYRYMAVLDGRTTVTCKTLSDMVLKAEDPWVRALTPPNHFGCRSMWTPIWRSSRFKEPTVIKPSEATLQLYLAKKEEFLRRVA